MAKTRGGSAAIVCAVVFGVLWVFTLILAVMFKVHLRDAEVLTEDARKELATYIKPGEMSHPHVVEVKGQVQEANQTNRENNSVIFGLLREIEILKRVINNNPNSSVASIQSEKTTKGIDDGQALFGEIERLKAEEASGKELILQLQDSLTEAQNKVVNVEKEKTSLAQSYQSDVNGLRSQLVSVQQAYDAFRAKVQKDMAELENRIKQIQDEGHQKLTEQRSVTSQKDDQIAALNQRIKDLEAKQKGGPDSNVDYRTMPDGQVVSLLSEENMVYINRGTRDHVRLGMTFQVYDKDDLIKVDQQLNELRGKATIEVVTLSEASAVGRIVRLDHGAVVREGDQIANIVYDPEATYKFFVYGEFDIDHSGKATDTDRRRIETMILQWEGKLASKSDADEGRNLSYDVDYLLLGIEPELPDPLPENVIDPELIAEHAARTKKFERYQSLVAEARELSIPILNQNRFLALVGYYQR